MTTTIYKYFTKGCYNLNQIKLIIFYEVIFCF